MWNNVRRQHGSWQVSCNNVAAPSPPPTNATECKLNVQRACPVPGTGHNSTCMRCAAALLNRSCPAGCWSGSTCDARLVAEACDPPPTAQQLRCFAVVESKCAQNRTGGHSFAANYTKCLECARAMSPCPSACQSPSNRCEGAWFEQGQ